MWNSLLTKLKDIKSKDIFRKVKQFVEQEYDFHLEEA